MPERVGSADSFDEFFGAPKTDNDNNDDDGKKSKQNDTPKTSPIAALIKSQPVVHHRQISLETKSNINSKKVPLTTSVKNTPATPKSIDSTPLKTYESDFDDHASADEKQKHSSLPSPPPPPKGHTPETSRRGSDSKVRVSYTIPNNNARRKERFLPYIRSKNRTKRLQKVVMKNDVEQRVLSAQNEKVSELESRLAELSRQLEAERSENKALRLIQRREEKALKKYEYQEYDVHRVARDYTHEIADVKEKITNEREIKIKLEKEIEDRDETLREQTKRMKFFEKLVYEPNLHEPEQLREKLKETDKQLKKYQEKITNKEKYIQSLEKTYRHEIHEELVKQRELRHEIEDHSKKYTDLLLRLEDKSRQLGTMHIYIQRGGRRPSYSPSMNLSKSRSLQSLQDTSPRFREKIHEYDQRRRDELKLKPKPKLKPIVVNSPTKPERKKYIPTIIPKPKPAKLSSIPVREEKPPIIENEYRPPKAKSPVRRLSTTKSLDEDKSDIEDEIITESKRPKPPSPEIIQRNEEYISQAPVYKRPITPVSPSPSPPPPPVKPSTTREFDEKWMDIFETKKKEESTKDDLLSKLISDEQQERKIVTTTKPSPPSSQRPSMIMFEPSSMLTNANQKKSPPRITTNNVYDFDQAIINLHEGKPVTTPTTITKTSVDPFASLFDNNTTKPTNRLDYRDDTFTTTQDKSDPFESIFTQSVNAVDTSTTLQPNLRQLPLQNDKLQRPKVVTNAPKPVPNRTVVEEIEEFVL